MIQTNFFSIPDELKLYPNWVCWKAEPDANSHSGIKKLPINPKTGKKAQSNNPETWSDFQTAYNACVEYGYSGIGFMFSNSPYFGVDVDDMPDFVQACLNGNYQNIVGEFVKELHSYTELSQSGNGIHIICKGKLPPKGRRKGKFEMYDSGRFFVMTGNAPFSDAQMICDCTETIKPLHQKYILQEENTTSFAESKSMIDELPLDSTTMPEAKSNNLPRTPNEVIKIAMKDPVFARLWSGDISQYNGDDSAGDIALMNKLAFYCGKDAQLMELTFNQSALAERAKWKSRADYRRTTIDKAIDDCQKVYSPNYRSSMNFTQTSNNSPNELQYPTLLKFAQLHSPQRYEDYKQAMNPHSKKYRTNSEHTANSSTNNRQQAREKHQKYVSPYDVDGTGRLSIPNLRAFVQAKNILIAYDEILRKTVCKTNGNGKNKQLLGNLLLSTIESELQSELRGVTAEKISRYLDVIADENRINPIRSMIEATQWDGKDRLEEWYQLFQIPETDTLSRTLIRKWAMQAVCGLYNDIERPFSLDIVLIFQGAQGIGKTRFFEHLAMLPPYFREGVVLDVTNKDSIMQATSAWICELGEIGSTMRKDIDRLKAFLTLSMDTFRVPYARLADEYPRRTSFVGTVNDSQFLLDQTGNRRFASVPLQLTHTLDYETQIKPFDALQFWAQILQIVRNAIAQGATMGGCFRLDETEKASLETRNSSLLKLLPFEQEFLDCMQDYERQKAQYQKSVEYRFCTITEWLTQNRYYMGSCSSVQLGKILAKNGYVQERVTIDGKRTRAYKLPFRTVQQV